MILALIVFLAMAAQDAATAAKIRLLQKCRPWQAGLAEAVNDLGAVFSIGVGGVTVVNHGVSLQSVEILVALATAAILGTVLGYRIVA